MCRVFNSSEVHSAKQGWHMILRPAMTGFFLLHVHVFRGAIKWDSPPLIGTGDTLCCYGTSSHHSL